MVGLSKDVALVGSCSYVVTKLTGQLEKLQPSAGIALSWRCTKHPAPSPRTLLEPGLWLGATHNLAPYDVHMDSELLVWKLSGTYAC